MQFLCTARPKAEFLQAGLPAGYEAMLYEERERARAFYVEGTIRHIWQYTDGPGVAIIFEAPSPDHLRGVLDAFPLVRAGYLDLTVIPLLPYAGFGPHAAHASR